MATTFYYRLPSDNTNEFLLWTGRVTAQSKLHLDGVYAVRERLGVKKLPRNTLVVSEHELKSGQWSSHRIREATLSREPREKKTYAKSVADVPTSFDDVQDMLKKFGLA